MNNNTWFSQIDEKDIKEMATRATGFVKREHFQNLGKHKHLGPIIAITGIDKNGESKEIILSQYGVVKATPKKETIEDFKLKPFLRENFEKNFPFRSVEYVAEKSFLDVKNLNADPNTIESRWLIEMLNATKDLQIYNGKSYFETYKEYHKAPILQEALNSSEDSFKNALHNLDARLNRLDENFERFLKIIEQDNTPTA